MPRMFPPPDGTQPEFRNDPADDGFVHITPDGRIAWSAVKPDGWDDVPEDQRHDPDVTPAWTFVVEVDGNGATFNDLGDSHSAVGLLIYTIATDREV